MRQGAGRIFACQHGRKCVSTENRLMGLHDTEDRAFVVLCEGFIL